MKRILILCLLVLWPLSAIAVGVDENRLPDPAEEQRARDLMKELRCLVCQNQSIDESDADLAKDLRTIVRERIAAGDSDAGVRHYLVERYGDWVLLDPPFNDRMVVLWLAPLALVILAAGGIFLALRRRRMAPPPPLSPEEEQRLQTILQEIENGDGAKGRDGA